MNDKHAYAYELVRQNLPKSELEKPERKSNKLSVDISTKLKWQVGDGRANCNMPPWAGLMEMGNLG